MARVLVLDGHCNAALAFTRSLGQAGYWVAVGCNRSSLAPAAYSRHCRLSFEYPPSTEAPAEFAAAVLSFVREHGIELVLPMTDWTTFPLVSRQSEFRDLAILAGPPADALEIVSDKYKTVLLARGLNIPTPDTLLARSVKDLETARGWEFPLVVKDRSSVRWLTDKAVFGSASYVYSWEELLHKVQERVEMVGDALVQRFVFGDAVGFSCFVLENKTHLPFQWQRVREENPCGGASCARKSVALDPQVLKFGSKLMIQSGFQGIGMVEFKRDPVDGRLSLMEINGRPWGSLQLAVESGIDYPRHETEWYLRGMRPPGRINYRKHITCRRFIGDLDHLARLRKGKPPNWPGKYPGFWPTLFKVAIPWYPGLRYEDLYFRDLRPGLAEMKHWFNLRLSKLIKSPHSKGIGRADTSDCLTIKGIVHCHTTLSYDGKVELGDLCKLLRQKGFGFLALTEHRVGVEAGDYEGFVQKCQEASDKNLIVIPGLEFRCDDGVEIAGIGVSKLLDAKKPEQIVAQIREVGGIALWVHPWRNGRRVDQFLDCDAVEVLNLKLDGTLAPNFSLLRRFVKQRRAGRHFNAIFGVDFHDLSQPLSVWLECRASENTPDAIIRSLREGRFVNRVPYASVSSSGASGVIDYALMGLFRLVFLIWAEVLRLSPRFLRTWLIARSRAALGLVRRNGTIQPPGQHLT